jgi:hypothetical protein
LYSADPESCPPTAQVLDWLRHCIPGTTDDSLKAVTLEPMAIFCAESHGELQSDRDPPLIELLVVTVTVPVFVPAVAAGLTKEHLGELMSPFGHLQYQVLVPLGASVP